MEATALDQSGAYEISHYTAEEVRNYECVHCKRRFTNPQALGGHMNVHRRDKLLGGKHRHKKKRPTPTSSSTSSNSQQPICSTILNSTLPSSIANNMLVHHPSVLLTSWFAEENREGTINGRAFTYYNYLPREIGARPLSFEPEVLDLELRLGRGHQCFSSASSTKDSIRKFV